MIRRTLLVISSLLFGPFAHATSDSPTFVVENRPAPPPAVAPADTTRVTFPDGSTLSARIEGTALQILRDHAPPYTLDAQANADTPPALDARADHVAIAWFSPTDGPRINVSTSSNAGVQWLMPVRVDDTAPIGRVSLVLLDDGAQIVSWVERLADDYVILLRRISPRGTLSVPVQLLRQSADPGHPRLTRIKDGDSTPAQLLLTCNQPASARLITLPDTHLLAAADACDCDPRPEDQRGYGIKGRIIAIHPDLGTLTVAHDAIPGVLKAATTTFRAAPDLLAAVQTGTSILARTERLGPDWWLFNPRTLVTP